MRPHDPSAPWFVLVEVRAARVHRASEVVVVAHRMMMAGHRSESVRHRKYSWEDHDDLPVRRCRLRDEAMIADLPTAIRIRPPLGPSDPGFDLIPQRFQRSIAHVTSPTSLAVDAPQGRKLFVFDRVFGEDVKQEGIWEYLSESVQAFVQGYNVSLLAYGQSGSGKSHTMGTSGPAEQSDARMMGKPSIFLRLAGLGWLGRRRC